MKSHQNKTVIGTNLSRFVIVILILLSLIIPGGSQPAAAQSQLAAARTGPITVSTSLQQTRSGSAKLTLHAAGQGNPWINIADAADLPSVYQGQPNLAQALQSGDAQPLSLAAADFDEDGVPDLLSGFASSGAGFISWQRGNVDAIYPNSPEAKTRKATGEFTDAAFFPTAQVFDLPVRPDFLGTGDFDADGHWDIIAAARGDEALYWLPGNGKGSFGAAKAVPLSGRVTALATGEINRRDGLTDVVVGINGENGPLALVFEWPQGALRGEPEVFNLPAEVTGLALGQMDGDYPTDLAIAAGQEVFIIHGRDRRLSLDIEHRTAVNPAMVDQLSFSFPILSMTAGDFSPNLDLRVELALLSTDGAVHIIDSSGNELDTAQVGNTEYATGNPQLVAAHIASLPSDSLVIVDSPSRQVHILYAPQETQFDSLVSLDIAAAPIAVLPMRLNPDGLSDLVILKNGALPLVVASTAAIFTFTVNNTGDQGDPHSGDNRCDTTHDPDANPPVGPSGICTLRAALEQSALSTGNDTINFNVGSGGDQTITPGSPLYAYNATLDATSQPGCLVPCIVLDGWLIPDTWEQAVLKTSGVVVRGFVINNSGYHGIHMRGASDIIEGNFIGTDITGTIDLGNQAAGIYLSSSFGGTIGGTAGPASNVISGNDGEGIDNNSGVIIVQGNLIGIDVNGADGMSNGTYGIDISQADSTIGGTQAGARNIISNNGFYGVHIAYSYAEGNLVQGNYIGTNFSGNAALGNTFGGVSVGSSASNNTIGGTTPAARNLISGNQQSGVNLSFAGTGNLVQGNYIGTNLSGSSALGNTGQGVYISYAASNTVGGSVAEARNLISGNGQKGIYIDGSSSNTDTKNNQVMGNYIGTNISGTARLANGGSGVYLSDAYTNIIGGFLFDDWNLISGNGDDGISIVWGGGNIVEGNLIGVQANALDPLANSGDGIDIGRSPNNTIGGTQAGQGNTISFNQGNGVKIWGGDETIQNTIRGNSIFSNTLLGIDLGGSGVSANDLGDADSGPNGTQNFPILTGVVRGGEGTTIEATLNSLPNKTYQIEFFSNPSCNASNYGEGKTLLGSRSVIPGGDGNAVFSYYTTKPVLAVTATATDPDGNTSEFSNCFAPFIVNSYGDNDDTSLGDGVCNTGGTVGGGPECTFRAALQESNAHPGRDAITFDIRDVLNPPNASDFGLPEITEAVFIDATGQSGGWVEMDAFGYDQNALVFRAPGSYLSGFIIQNYTDSGILAYGDLTIGSLQVLNNGKWGIVSTASITVENSLKANDNGQAQASAGGVILDGNLSAGSASLVEVKNNPGPGIYSSIEGKTFELKNAVISQNGGDGLHLMGDLTLRGANTISQNGGNGILIASTQERWATVDALDVLDNDQWGISLQSGSFAATGAGMLRINRNGQDNSASSRGGLLVGHTLNTESVPSFEVKDNHGDGIRALSNEAADLVHLENIQVSNNWEDGLDLGGAAVALYGTNSVNFNTVNGIVVRGLIGREFSVDTLEVRNNGRWGVWLYSANLVVTADSAYVRINDNGQDEDATEKGGLRVDSGKVATGAVISFTVQSNGGDGVRLMREVTDTITSTLQNVDIRKNLGRGLLANVDVTLYGNAICDNYAGNIVVSGELTLAKPVDFCDTDGDNVSDNVENQAPNSGDGNNDGTGDSQQPKVVSLLGANGNWLTSVSTLPMSGVYSGDNVYDDPPGLIPPYGVFGFEILGVTAGGAITVTLIFTEAIPADSHFYQYGPTPDNATPHWYDFAYDGTTGAEIQGNTVILHFVDGQRGDDDLTADGKIDPYGGVMSQVSQVWQIYLPLVRR